MSKGGKKEGRARRNVPVLMNVRTSPFALSSWTSRDRRPMSASRSKA